MERVRVLDAVQMVIDMAGYSPDVVTQPDKPTGPANRVADNSLAKQLSFWEPEVLFAHGLRRTWEWYVANKSPEQVREIFDFMLTGRAKPHRPPPAPRVGCHHVGGSAQRSRPFSHDDVTRHRDPRTHVRRPRGGPRVGGVRIDVLTWPAFFERLDDFLACGRGHVLHYLAADPTVVARANPATGIC
jgi:hypothetical protein